MWVGWGRAFPRGGVGGGGGEEEEKEELGSKPRLR